MTRLARVQRRDRRRFIRAHKRTPWLALALLLTAAPAGAATAQHFKIPPFGGIGPVPHPPIVTPIIIHVVKPIPPFGGLGPKLPSAKRGRAFSISVSFGGPRK